ncbi:hypothetical protein D3C83_253430 [compost metagenome]
MLWKGEVAGPSQGIPVLYESKGRAYVLFMSPASGSSQRAPTRPSGYIAFALPRSN